MSQFTQMVVGSETFLPITKQQNGSFVYRAGTSFDKPRLVISTRLPTVRDPAARSDLNLQSYESVITSDGSKLVPRSMFSVKAISDLGLDAEGRKADLARFRALVASDQFANWVVSGDVIYT